MLQRIKASRHVPRDLPGLTLLACQLLSLFAVQGAIILAYYAVTAPPADHERLPFGLQLDPIHAALHLVVGIVAAYVGFWRPSAASTYLRAFAVLYLGLAAMGTFTGLRFGMHLEIEENLFHWAVGSAAFVIAFGPALLPSTREGTS